MTTNRLPSPAPARRMLVGAIAAVAVAATAGGIVGVQSLRDQGSVQGIARAPVAGAVNPIHTDVETSFGLFAVDGIDKTAGLTSRSLAGATHSPTHVPADQMLVAVNMDIRNRRNEPVRLLHTQFRVRSGATLIPPRDARVRTMELQPRAGVDQIITYMVPRNGRRLTLEFADRPGSHPLLVDLGRASARVEGAPDATPGTHDHTATPGTP